MTASTMQAMNCADERRANPAEAPLDCPSVRRWPRGKAFVWLAFALAALPVICSAAPTPHDALVPDTTLAIPPLHFDSAGALSIRPVGNILTPRL